jgi:hypothetical protein
VDLLRDNSAKRPVALFLAGQSIERGTTGPVETIHAAPSPIHYADASASFAR